MKLRLLIMLTSVLLLGGGVGTIIEGCPVSISFDGTWPSNVSYDWPETNQCCNLYWLLEEESLMCEWPQSIGYVCDPPWWAPVNCRYVGYICC